MAATEQIKGLFSKEHAALIVLIGFSLYGTWSNHLELIELKIQNAKAIAKIETLLSNYGKTSIPFTASFRQKRKSKYQKAVITDISHVRFAFDTSQSGYRVYQTACNSDRHSYHICGC